MGIRQALLALIAVPAILLGLLAMHALGGSSGHDGGHAMPVAHAAGAEASGHAAATVPMEPTMVPVAAAAGAAAATIVADPGGDGMAAIICLLALLAVLLLGAAAAPLRLSSARRLVALTRRLASTGRRPVPSLLELSISRT